ncbi:MAG: hypothetical protein ACYSWP_12835 [Planctomycetota bacterium]|jgi:hypothetical protein
MTEFKVCPRCRGTGRHVHEALSVWTEDDRREDPEGFDNMRAGDYDVACGLCGGEKVVEDSEEADEARREDAEDRRIRMMESGIWPYGPY